MHSAVANWKKCLHSIKLKDSVLSLVYVLPSPGLGIRGGPAHTWLTSLPFQARERTSTGGSGRWDSGHLPPR